MALEQTWYCDGCGNEIEPHKVAVVELHRFGGMPNKYHLCKECQQKLMQYPIFKQ